MSETRAELPKAYHDAVVHWQTHEFPDHPALERLWDRYFPRDEPFCLCAKVADGVSDRIEVGERRPAEGDGAGAGR